MFTPKASHSALSVSSSPQHLFSRIAFIYFSQLSSSPVKEKVHQSSSNYKITLHSINDYIAHQWRKKIVHCEMQASQQLSDAQTCTVLAFQRVPWTPPCIDLKVSWLSSKMKNRVAVWITPELAVTITNHVDCVETEKSKSLFEQNHTLSNSSLLRDNRFQLLWEAQWGRMYVRREWVAPFSVPKHHLFMDSLSKDFEFAYTEYKRWSSSGFPS